MQSRALKVEKKPFVIGEDWNLEEAGTGTVSV